MRRKDRELTDINAIFEVIKNCSVAHVAMVDDGKPRREKVCPQPYCSTCGKSR